MRAAAISLLLVGCSSSSQTTPAESGEAAPPPPEAKELFAWLDPAKHPMLVQLPASAYEALRSEWALP